MFRVSDFLPMFYINNGEYFQKRWDALVVVDAVLIPTQN